MVKPATQWSKQSVVSYLLLALLCTIGTATFLIHEQTRDTTFIIIPPVEPGQTVLTDPESAPAFSLPLPPGFEFFSNPEQYTADNLYEKINGKAPLYLQAGFVSLTSRRFRSSQQPELWFEASVYDMANSHNAFAVYSMQKRSGAATVPDLEVDHYKTENGLYLQYDRYYLEIVGSAVSTVLDAGMSALARELLAAAPEKEEKVNEFRLFPVQNLDLDGFKLIPENAFGSDLFAATFVARYQLNGQQITAFIAPQDSPEQAQQVAADFYRFLLENGGSAEEPVSSMQTVDLYGLLEIVFAAGPYVAGVHEGENRQQAVEIADRLRNALVETEQNIKESR